MKWKTALRIEKAAPYALSVLAAAGTFAVARCYGNFCEKVGVEAGTGAVLEAFTAHYPKETEELLERVDPPWNFED